LAAAIEQFERMSFSEEDVRNNAGRFSSEDFRGRMATLLNELQPAAA
jgi:hypothetical protein